MSGPAATGSVSIERLTGAQTELAAEIKGLLTATNTARGQVSGRRPVTLAIRDGADLVAGLLGDIAWDWLFVGYLVVAEATRGRGLGSRLLAEAERIAVAEGCVGVWLDTLTFEAPGLYRRHGYTEVGQIPDHPRGHARHFFMKRLDGA